MILNRLEENTVTTIKHYTIFGDHELIDGEGYPVTSNEAKVCARILGNQKGRIWYQVRINRVSDPYHPIDDSGYRSKIDKALSEVRFKDVSKETFQEYLYFLKNKSESSYTKVRYSFL